MESSSVDCFNCLFYPVQGLVLEILPKHCYPVQGLVLEVLPKHCYPVQGLVLEVLPKHCYPVQGNVPEMVRTGALHYRMKHVKNLEKNSLNALSQI